MLKWNDFEGRDLEQNIKVEIITEAEEDKLWEKGEVGDMNSQALLNTIVYMVSLYFALRSSIEHKNLRFEPSQIQICEREGERPYLLYTEDTSKNCQGGLKGRHITPKSVQHHANTANPERCTLQEIQVTLPWQSKEKLTLSQTTE